MLLAWTRAWRVVPVVFLVAVFHSSAAAQNTISLAVGSNHACSITNSTTFCWGQGGNGQVGDGTTTATRPLPVAVSGATTFAKVAAGASYSCALNGAGAAFCWGFNSYGQLGDGSTTQRTTPVAVAGGVTFSALSGGVEHTCGLALNGSVYCWGRNNAGQLGDGTTIGSRSMPTPVALGRTYASTSAGFSHTCAIGSDSNAYCWGNNQQGSLGDNSTNSSGVPVRVLYLTFATSITTGYGHTCALTTGGPAYCWGSNASGQLGDGTTTSRLRSGQVAGNLRFTSIGAGTDFTCGVATGGVAYCWGRNNLGQLGDGTSLTSRSTAAALAGGLVLASLSVGGSHACGLTTGGQAYCWGFNGSGQVGIGSYVQGGRSPLAVVGNRTFTAISAGSSHTCGVVTGGTAYCWGSNQSGQLGDGSSSLRSGSPVAVVGVTLVSISAGGDHTCGLTAAGAAYCWGSNSNDALGTGSATTPLRAPALVQGGLTFATLTAGNGYTCGITVGGVEYCWGRNGFSVLGDGTTVGSRSVPVPVAGGVTVRSVSAGGSHTCGVATGVYCWGSNAYGQLGDTTVIDRRAPVRVSGLIGFSDVTAGATHTCALASVQAGQVVPPAAYCWGANNLGQLGNGTMAPSVSPTAVSGALTFTAIVTRQHHTCGLSRGNAYCWGHNQVGQLGSGTMEDSPTPAVTLGGLVFTAVATGDDHTCGLTNSNAVYCWGGSDIGQLGVGGPSASYLPVHVQFP